MLATLAGGLDMQSASSQWVNRPLKYRGVI